VDRLGTHLLSQSESALDPVRTAELGRLLEQSNLQGAYHKRLSRQVRRTAPEKASPQLVLGSPASERFLIRENGLRFELSFSEGYSVGLFLDQRDNRRRLQTGHVCGGFPSLSSRSGAETVEVLNAFSYTCGFSVSAAKAGARVTSLDLSRKYLDWGRRNFELNELDPAAHDFIYGDALDWMKRLRKKERSFNVVILDPPTFSQSKQGGVFRAEKDYGELVQAAAALLLPQGVLLTSTNAAGWVPDAFLDAVRTALKQAGRRVIREHYQPQPVDFPIARDEPAYLKTAWFALD
jgi:23S rRNA (cytosine1962-C5)-methyltransferase